MIRLALIAFVVVMVFMVAITLIVTVAIVAAMALAVGIPVYLAFKRHDGPRRVRLNPIEALQELYAEGKIDLTEFERRVARLVAIEH